VPSGKSEEENTKAAEAAVIRILLATTAEQALEIVPQPKSVAAAVQEAFAASDKSTLAVEKVAKKSSTLLADKRRQFIFEVTAQNRPTFYVATVETPQGYRVPWALYQESRNAPFHDFLATKAVGKTGKFHLELRRAHYFESDVPNLDERFVFQVSAPTPEEQKSFVFIDKTTPLAQQLDAKLKWDDQYLVVASLGYAKAGAGTILQLNAVDQWGWFVE
jgi:hypothetical protein